VNPGENVGIWLAIMAVSAGLAAWNISRLRIVRPALDRLVALIGSAAIVMVVIGASLVVTEITECTLSAVSSLACSKTEILRVAVMDLVASAALITQWLRADACRASFAAVQVRGIPPTRRPRDAT
jgi:hypothetical protein